MPLFTLCAYPGCHSPVLRGDRYCDRHKEAGAKRDAEAKAKAAKRREQKRVQIAGNAPAVTRTVGRSFEIASSRSTPIVKSASSMERS